MYSSAMHKFVPIKKKKTKKKEVNQVCVCVLPPKFVIIPFLLSYTLGYLTQLSFLKDVLSYK